MRTGKILSLVILFLTAALILSNTIRLQLVTNHYDKRLTSINKQLDNMTKLLQKTQETNNDYKRQLKRMRNYILNTEEQYEAKTQRLLKLIEQTEKRNNIQLERLRKELKDNDVSDVVQQVSQAAVTIQTNISKGSGAVIDKNTIVTNHHVIRGVTNATVITRNGDKHKATVIKENMQRDLALLKADLNITPIPLGSMDNVATGETVFAIGNPQGFAFTVTEGIISRKKRSFEDGTYIQTDVPISSGSSGSPLITTNGTLIGINTFKIEESNNLGFAIPVSQVKSLLNDTKDQ